MIIFENAGFIIKACLTNRSSPGEDLIIQAWVPFNKNEQTYWFMIFFQLISIEISTIGSVASDMLFASLILEIYIQFEFLFERFLTISESIKLEIGEKKIDNRTREYLEEKVIKRNIQHYQLIFK